MSDHAEINPFTDKIFVQMVTSASVWVNVYEVDRLEEELTDFELEQLGNWAKIAGMELNRLVGERKAKEEDEA